MWTMDIIRASTTGHLAPALEWRIDNAEQDQGSVASRLTKECILVFRKLMKKLPKENELSIRTFRKLEQSCSSLILWDSGYGVAKGDLDDVLAKSRTLNRSILWALISISRTLTDRSLIRSLVYECMLTESRPTTSYRPERRGARSPQSLGVHRCRSEDEHTRGIPGWL